MSAQPEQWRVSTHEGVFETDLETLRQWILERAVLPTDKVSKGNLNWIDAGRVPQLKRAFNGEVDPAIPTQKDSATTDGGWQTPPPIEAEQPSRSTPVVKGALSTSCHNHPGVQPKYVCRMCATTF